MARVNKTRRQNDQLNPYSSLISSQVAVQAGTSPSLVPKPQLNMEFDLTILNGAIQGGDELIDMFCVFRENTTGMQCDPF